MLARLGFVTAVTLFATMFAVSSAAAPVGRGRVETFARRHQLRITPANGNAVIRYLATTRRWRAAGLIGGLLASLLATLPTDSVSVNSVALLAGWFVGALAAEARLTRPPHGARRSASLSPRHSRDYLPRLVSLLLPTALVINIAIACAASVSARAPLGREWAWATSGVLVAIACFVVQGRVLRRPQSPGSADVLAADNAIRSRSLHAINAGGVALVLFCVLGQLAALNSPQDPEEPVLFLGAMLVAALGWTIALLPWPVGGAANTTAGGAATAEQP